MVAAGHNCKALQKRKEARALFPNLNMDISSCTRKLRHMPAFHRDCQPLRGCAGWPLPPSRPAAYHQLMISAVKQPDGLT